MGMEVTMAGAFVQLELFKPGLLADPALMFKNLQFFESVHPLKMMSELGLGMLKMPGQFVLLQALRIQGFGQALQKLILLIQF